MNVLIAGHSYVRRLDFDLKVRQLRFLLQDVNVTLCGYGGATIRAPKPLLPCMRAKTILSGHDMVILDLGSNDLDTVRHPEVDTHELAQEYLDLAKYLLEYGAKTIVLCLPIPRSERAFPGSFERTSTFNDHVTRECKDTPNVYTWFHKGLFKRDGKYLDKHGVHLNALGSIKYFHSLRAAVKFHGRKIPNTN